MARSETEYTIDCVYHLRKVLNPIALNKHMDYVVPVIRALKRKHKFQAIAVTGLSGIIYGSVLSARINVPLTVVRSSGVSCHSPKRIEGRRAARLSKIKYAIVDDFISSGKTVRRIISRIKNYHDSTMEPAIAFFYLMKAEAHDTPVWKDYLVNGKIESFKKPDTPKSGVPIYGLADYWKNIGVKVK